MNKVHIEFRRLQTWLFSVPRLRAMVGANTLLGETLRVGLPELAREGVRWSLMSVRIEYPIAHLDDPLADHDDPIADAKQGILSRDGGHFEAAFSAGADAFADAAAALLHMELPGLRFRISVDGSERADARAELCTELPVFARCEWTGRGLASRTVRQGNEHAEVALEVFRRHEAARRAENGNASDLASLLIGCTKLSELQRPTTFEDIAGDGYLAVVHADGNAVGSAAGSNEAERGAFFHRNRMLLRRALQFAINQVCEGTETAPVLPLMLGGDDLLVVCRADLALPFVVSLCGELERLQLNSGNTFQLTLGCGVVFSKPTVPFNRLHEVAENLAGSAKRLFRGFEEHDRRSVADWAVYTTAWLDDTAELRRRDWVRGSGGDMRVLSSRPLRVVGDGLVSLEGLLQAAESLDSAPRSQLRYLVDQLARGKALSELAFAELTKPAADILRRAGVSELWTRSHGTGPYVTSLLDWVEVFEIGKLGRGGTKTRLSDEFETDDIESENVDVEL